MTTELALQQNLFTGELEDTRTRQQKQHERDRNKPQQGLMFAQSEIAQFGVDARPLLPLSETTKLLLIPEDHRTQEEIDRDIQREAEKRTAALFCTALIPYIPPEKSLVVYEPPNSVPHFNRGVQGREQNIAALPDDEFLLFCSATIQGFAFSVL